MGEYTIWQWILFFFLYCFLGWCIESTIVSVKQKRPVNRGFLFGPMLPIYGFGAVGILIVTVPVKGNYVLEYILGMLAATVLEYVGGCIMEAIFHVKYWDYSYRKIQFQGRICLVSSLFWGVLAVFLTEVIHEPVADIVTRLPKKTCILLVCGIGSIMLIDCVFAVKRAFEVSALLQKLDKVRIEMERLSAEVSKRLGAAEEQISQARESLVLRNEKQQQLVKERLELMKAERETLMKRMNRTRRRWLKAYPHFTSKRFKSGWQDLKDYISNLR